MRPHLRPARSGVAQGLAAPRWCPITSPCCCPCSEGARLSVVLLRSVDPTHRGPARHLIGGHTFPRSPSASMAGTVVSTYSRSDLGHLLAPRMLAAPQQSRPAGQADPGQRDRPRPENRHVRDVPCCTQPEPAPIDLCSVRRRAQRRRWRHDQPDLCGDFWIMSSHRSGVRTGCPEMGTAQSAFCRASRSWPGPLHITGLRWSPKATSATP